MAKWNGVNDHIEHSVSNLDGKRRTLASCRVRAGKVNNLGARASFSLSSEKKSLWPLTGWLVLWSGLGGCIGHSSSNAAKFVLVAEVATRMSRPSSTEIWAVIT